MTPRPLYIVYRVLEMLVSLVSRFLNATFFGGSTHQTLSARSYIEPLPRTGEFINALFFWQDNHIKWAWEREVAEAERTLKRSKRSALNEKDTKRDLDI
jgi:hypothetical protein